GDASSTPASGWAPCHAFDRDDNTPSADICLDRSDKNYGCYKDHKSGETAIRFFEWMARLRGTDWQSIRDEYAERTGVPLLSVGKANGKQSWLDKIKLHDHGTTPLMAHLWACHKPPIDAETAVR